MPGESGRARPPVGDVSGRWDDVTGSTTTVEEAGAVVADMVDGAGSLAGLGGADHEPFSGAGSNVSGR